MHVDKHNEKTERKIRNRLIDLINFLNLIAQEFENFLFTFSLWSQSVRAFLWAANREADHVPPVHNPDSQLNLPFENHSQDKTFMSPLTNLQLEIDLLKFAKVSLQIYILTHLVRISLREVIVRRLGELFLELVQKPTCLLEAAVSGTGTTPKWNHHAQQQLLPSTTILRHSTAIIGTD